MSKFPDGNESMRAKIANRIIGHKIVAFEVEGRKILIHVEGPSVVTLEFENVHEFELKTGGWKFTPTGDPGRPKKKKADAVSDVDPNS